MSVYGRIAYPETGEAEIIEYGSFEDYQRDTRSREPFSIIGRYLGNKIETDITGDGIETLYLKLVKASWEPSITDWWIYDSDGVELCCGSYDAEMFSFTKMVPGLDGLAIRALFKETA
jgi:hypothetical protein